MKINLFLFISLSFLTFVSNAQFKVFALDSSMVPKQIHYIGHIINAVKWKDDLGLHYVLTTETGRIHSKGEPVDEDLTDAFLYAYHYVMKSDTPKLIWRVYDFNKGCDLDLEFYFLDHTFAVTDLDKNGIPEVWMMYRNSCHGDVSPSSTKIIMYEGTKKYALRGESLVKIQDIGGGSYAMDENFKKSLPVFKQYAEKLWEKHKVENWHR